MKNFLFKLSKSETLSKLEEVLDVALKEMVDFLPKKVVDAVSAKADETIFKQAEEVLKTTVKSEPKPEVKVESEEELSKKRQEIILAFFSRKYGVAAIDILNSFILEDFVDFDDCLYMDTKEYQALEQEVAYLRKKHHMQKSIEKSRLDRMFNKTSNKPVILPAYKIKKEPVKRSLQDLKQTSPVFSDEFFILEGPTCENLSIENIIKKNIDSSKDNLEKEIGSAFTESLIQNSELERLAVLRAMASQEKELSFDTRDPDPLDVETCEDQDENLSILDQVNRDVSNLEKTIDTSLESYNDTLDGIINKIKNSKKALDDPKKGVFTPTSKAGDASTTEHSDEVKAFIETLDKKRTEAFIKLLSGKGPFTKSKSNKDIKSIVSEIQGNEG